MSFLDALWTEEERNTAHLQDTVPANTTEWTKVVSWPVPADATVETVTAWHVPGSQDALKTKPMYKTSTGTYDLVDYAHQNEQFITGEPADREYYTDKSVSADDEIIVRAKNESADHAYRFVVTPTLDYAGGTQRFLGGVL